MAMQIAQGKEEKKKSTECTNNEREYGLGLFIAAYAALANLKFIKFFFDVA